MPADLPPLEELIRKSDAELLRILAQLGATPDLEGLDAVADQIFERVASGLRAGVPLDEAKWVAIDRQIELAAERAVRIQVKALVSNYRLTRMRDLDGDFMWVAIEDANTCESCDERHGESKSMEEWQVEGLPRSPALICGAECRCELLLVPAEEGADPYIEIAQFAREEAIAP